jgi:antitoxin (DNA-binding transcriptional repressor) of toxin-antitoxin stability system
MTQVNMHEAKTSLSKLVRMLETKEEDYIVLARDGKAVAKIIPFCSGVNRNLRGLLNEDEDAIDWNVFDAADAEVGELFGV